MRKRILNILFWSVISAAFIGPGTVTTAAKAGVDFGLSLLWALSFATIACLTLQEAAARLTIVSGMNLGQAIALQSENTKRKVLIPLMVIVCILTGTAAYETGNLLGAVAGINLLFSGADWIMVLVMGLMAGVLLMVPSIKIIARIMGGLVAVMGILFLVSAISINPPLTELLSGMIRPVIPDSRGGGLLVLGLVGTTVVPYNLFLGSGISKGQSLTEMRSGLLGAVVLGGIISMAVLVTGTSMTGDFTFTGLADSLNEHIGNLGYMVLGVGLFAAGFTSAVTAPLASAVTVRSLLGHRKPGLWKDGSRRFRIVWISVLLTGMGFGMAGFKPVPAIVLAQALNGLILPLIAVYLFITINDKGIMQTSFNRMPGNILMSIVVYITIIIGLAGILRAVMNAMKIESANWGMIMLILAIISVLLLGIVLLKISSNSRK